MKKLLLPAAALLSLSACASWFHREGVGFTGIDGEPKSVTAEKGSADYVSRRLSLPAELASKPTPRLQSDKGDMESLAKVAIANGGRNPNTAVEAGAGDIDVFLSTVEVNGVLFAVLRTAEDGIDRLPEGAGAGFAQSVPRLTGCLAGGQVYQAGTAKRASGLAVPLNCS
ncbi:hypothetical protein OEZ49_11015 [Ruegeria sp. WL0004]|uniref:Lipoprotein n=1 Tax=Ruegeria marisflavi TaxID=2984152 RepID=A0ABT2WRP7_9RHOB|nr:hypothetical protein [Ruegeria sp. WL0004]MCU9838298.1 hypothetical protein [Ruegeria sp. WL0004]